jgi:hypothetical protein
LGLEKPNSGPDPGESFFPNSVSDLGSPETFPKSRNVGPVIDENVCLLDSQPWHDQIGKKPKPCYCPFNYHAVYGLVLPFTIVFNNLPLHFLYILRKFKKCSHGR